MLAACRLPPALSKELLDHLYLKQLTAVPLFHGLSEQVLAKLCFAMKPFKAMKYDYIFREGEVGREFFIIEEGTVELSRYQVLLARLVEGATFGEDALSAGRKKRERSALATQDCDLVVITKDDILTLSQTFPELSHRLLNVSSDHRRFSFCRSFVCAVDRNGRAGPNGRGERRSVFVQCWPQRPTISACRRTQESWPKFSRGHRRWHRSGAATT